MEDQVCPALRRVAQIGTLYDAKADKFLQASILPSSLLASYISTRPTSVTDITVSKCASYMNVFEDLHIDEDTAVNILAGLHDLQGAAVFIRDYTSGSGDHRAAIIHHVSTVQQTLNNVIEAFKSCSDLTPLGKSDCTHVVTGINWGLRTIIAANSPMSSKFGRPEEEDIIFQGDLNTLTYAIESAFLTPKTPPKLELCDELMLYSDIFAKEGLVMQDISEICNFIRIVPDHIRRENGGKGWPIEYILTPITALSYILSSPLGFRYSLHLINHDYLAAFIQLFDKFEVSAVGLQKYEAYLVGHTMHTSKNHLNQVVASMKALEDLRSWTAKRLSYALQEARKGKGGPPMLFDLYQQATTSGNFTVEHASAIIRQESSKLDFISSVTAQGARYLGFNGISLETVNKLHKHTRFYVFHFNSASMDVKKQWDNNSTLLLELLGQPDQPDQHIPVYLLDHDSVNSYFCSDAGPCISQYEGEKEIIPDVLDHRQFMSSKCFAQCPDAALDTSRRQRPVKRCIVRVPCPKPDCDSKCVEWVCSVCLVEIEFGYSDEHFYCDCGRAAYSTFEFKCNDSKHGAKSARYDAKELHKLLTGLDEADYINILILGETGVGKSTFINAFVNYLTYSTLDEAMAVDELTSVIPCSFSLQSMDRANLSAGIQEYNIKVGARDDEVDGSTGKSATQKSSVYPVKIGTKTYRLIDTPGIGDTRGLSYDKENMADILKAISSYEHLHGILVLVKSNNARLTITFRFCVKELLTHLHRSAAKSMAFGFTNTRISNYAPGDTFKPLRSLLDEHSDIPITLSATTTYCFDSESFRFLAAYKQGVPLTNEEDFRTSWDHSSKEAHRLLNYFASTPPHPVASTISLNGARKLILELTKPMASIAESIRKNIALCVNKRSELFDTKSTARDLRKRLRIEKIQFAAKKLDKPRTVCQNHDCCDFKDSGLGDGAVVTIYKTHCHPECYLDNVKEDVVADPGLIRCTAFGGSNICRLCSHRWQEHLHVLYELSETKVLVTDTEIERQLKSNADDVTLRQTSITRLDKIVEEYKQELDEIRRAAARFCLFLRENSITVINDATLDYLDMLIQDEKSIIETANQRGIPTNKKRLKALQEDRQIHLQLVETFKQNMLEPTGPEDVLLDEQGVDALVKKLYALQHFGENLKHIKYVIEISLEETSRERPYRCNGYWETKQWPQTGSISRQRLVTLGEQKPPIGERRS
ncbi:hypothetical protein TRIATDRAFT_289308 [Trichoderma atroviride IMI 206040]|uniref:Uncharacterized protein n=1 Tax=Hypocrea atroviridis (strain ATCC 20476 / IMI 206040) TaxID=452589 RepID=G9NH19_HYPAI|nr:uncharacterized protein TRIATDRAFT_289308 [Trichoderma atroviride IMI 206040]EHK49915.1 hypothetical protein TRIATDRAFT_289308 [Trichoderma atroviride IMI 206040]